MVRCLFFDFFGTLVNYSASRTEQGYHRTHQRLNDLGIELSYEEFLELWICAASRMDDWSTQHNREYPMVDVGSEFVRQLGIENADMAKELADSYLEEWSAGITHIKGIDNLISGLAKRYQLGIVSNTHAPDLIHRELDRMGIADKFSWVVTSLEWGIPKPDPSLFEHALARAGVCPNEAVFVGDNYLMDYLGATKAGISCYLVGQHARVPREKSIPSVLDLPRLL